ncbi:MAG: hypothetical protein ACOVQY_09450 [Erythrobacter sp.]
MDFWKSQTAREDENEERDDAREPSFLQKLTEFAKDEAKGEAISSAVEFLTDGWLTYDGGDDEDEDPRRKKQPEGTFEERLARSLAELQSQPVAPPQDAPLIAEPRMPVIPVQSPVPPAPSFAAARPLRPGPGGFGRKGL